MSTVLYFIQKPVWICDGETEILETVGVAAAFGGSHEPSITLVLQAIEELKGIALSKKTNLPKNGRFVSN